MPQKLALKKTEGQIQEPERESQAQEVQDNATHVIYEADQIDAAAQAQANSPEALVSATIKLLGQNGSEVLFTQRGSHAKTTLDALADALAYASDEYGLRPSRGNQQYQSNQTQPRSAQEPQEKKVTKEGYEVISSGSSEVNMVTVMGDHVEFSVGKFEWPFRDKRPPNVIHGLFDPEIGFEQVHFESPAVYTPEDWGGVIVADWEKISKNGKTYYNITRIYRR